MKIYEEFVGKLVDVYMKKNAFDCATYLNVMVLKAEGAILKLGFVKGDSPGGAHLKRVDREFSEIRVVNAADGIITFSSTTIEFWSLKSEVPSGLRFSIESKAWGTTTGKSKPFVSDNRLFMHEVNILEGIKDYAPGTRHFVDLDTCMPIK